MNISTVPLALLTVVCFALPKKGITDEVQPITKLKKLYLDTDLVREGTTRAVIYHPPGLEWEKAARELSGEFEAQYGVPLAVMPDDENRTWKQEKRNIIILGNLGNSHLLRWLHYRSFIAPPNGVKRRLRTVHDPWGQGRNVVMLGGIDLASVKENFPRLFKFIKKRKDGTVFIPRVLDPPPSLSPYYKTNIADDRKNLDKMPMNYPAYHAGWVCKHYPQIGHEDFIPLYRDCIKRLSDKKSYVHLYLFRESRAWDVIEESPALTDEDRLMITNFFRSAVADEKEGIGYVRRSMRGHRLVQGNHPTQAACGVMVVADYLRKYYPSELHEKWYQEALAFFEPYRTKGSYVGDDEAMQGASISNIMSAVYQTADDPAKHPFLRRMLDRLMPNCNNFGMWPAYGDQVRPYRFGAGYYDLGAHIYGSPEYLWMEHFIRTAGPSKRAQIPTEKPKGEWWPLDFAPRQPKGFVGLQWAEPDDILFSMARPHWTKANNITKDDLFGRAAFRAGIDPQDDYLLLDGVHLGHAYDDQNGILEYSALGRTFLVSLDYCYGTKQSAHNVVAASVDGMADACPPKVAVRRLWADFPSFAATKTVLYTDGKATFNYPSADWERNILWLKNRFFIVFDRIIAKREGMHSAVGFWRMIGERHDLPNGIEMKQKSGDTPVRFRLLVGGVDDFAIGREEDPQATYLFTRYGEQKSPLDNVPPIVHILKAHKARPLKADESLTMWTCFWASSAKRPNEVTCRTITPQAVRVELNQKPMLAALGSVALDGLVIDAELSLVASDRVYLVAGKKLALGDKTVFESERPVSFEWNLTTGQCEIDAKDAAKASFLGKTLDVQKGQSGARIEGGDLSKQLAAVLAKLPVASKAEPKKHLPNVADQLQVVGRRDGKSGVECLWAGMLSGQKGSVLVGRRDGSVEALVGDALKPAWTYRCERVVNSIDVGDLNGDGGPEIAVGSDDHHLHALSRDGKLLWKWKPPFDWQKAKIAYSQWLWPEPFVKKVAVHDLNGDGKSDIVAGTGMNTFGVSGEGKQLWAFRNNKSHCPSMRAIVFLDVNGDGIEEPVGGASDMWYCAPMWAIGPKGQEMPIGPKGELKYFSGDGWCSGVKVAVAEDLLGKGKKGLAYGTRLGGLWCYPDPDDWSKRWYRRFADEIDLLVTMCGKDKTKLIVVAGGDTKWVTAFDPDGNRVWAVYFDHAISSMAASSDQDRLYVGCEDGTVFELDSTGRLLRSIRLDGKPRVIVAPPAAGVVVGMEQGGVFFLR
ncbi:MAG: hypothetical protein GXP25_14220 [Planctomycetes bacterium]|nr:hypothetical protein [Planctomycetota bacterium]